MTSLCFLFPSLRPVNWIHCFTTRITDIEMWRLGLRERAMAGYGWIPCLAVPWYSFSLVIRDFLWMGEILFGLHFDRILWNYSSQYMNRDKNHLSKCCNTVQEFIWKYINCCCCCLFCLAMPLTDLSIPFLLYPYSCYRKPIWHNG